MSFFVIDRRNERPPEEDEGVSVAELETELALVKEENRQLQNKVKGLLLTVSRLKKGK